ncbi:hypothetical protein [Desulfurobacterium atlanticum]|uniref:hypothetical protein n=1 Tax=Desulfurobacterium atlanticum TaxID=240169 RepID=UPI001177509D|nr:hypothetical protein [Desulfurobacterium atlanticum]
MKRFLTVLTVLMVFCVKSTFAQIAVFPIRDLTVYPPGIDLDLTDRIVNALKKRGVDVVDQKDLYRKLSEKGLFATGVMDIPKVAAAYELKVATILWGTKLEVDKKKHLYGVVVFATSVPEGKTFWSRVFYYQPEEHLLDIGNNLSENRIKELIVNRIAAVFPERMTASKKAFSKFHIEHFSISPRYVKSGEPVSILLKSTKGFKKDEIVVHIDGDSVVLRRVDGDYEGIYVPRLREGKYPVYINVNGKKLFLDELTIDNTPPGVYLELKGLKRLGKIDFLPGKLFITAGLKRPDSVLHWNLVILNEDGDVIFKKFGYGAPIISFNWDPVRNNLPEGIYEIKFTVTDAAGNKAVLKKRFYFFHEIPVPEVKVYRDKDGNIVLSIGKINIPTGIKKIKVTVYSPKGYPLGKAELESLPAEITFKAKYNSLKVRLYIEDKLGNKLEKDFNPQIKSYKEIMEERGWVEEF